MSQIAGKLVWPEFKEDYRNYLQGFSIVLFRIKGKQGMLVRFFISSATVSSRSFVAVPAL